jgi:drug/metabolite transporter (DMT)-like permease
MLDADPMWVICNKELVSVVAVGPWLLYQTFRGTPVLPPHPEGTRLLALLILVGLANQVGANLGLQWALGVVGLAVSTPVVFGVMLTASALLGLGFLGERVSRRSILAIGLLLGALVLLGAATYATCQSGAPGGGAELRPRTVFPEGSLKLEPSHPPPDSRLAGPLLLALGIGAPCLAGAIYAVLTTTIRHAVTSAVPIGTIVFITTLMGVLSLGPLSAYRLGARQLAATPPEQIAWMAAAGILNLIAFLAITKGLHLTTVVHANVLNASQVAMAAVAGTLIFAEPRTPWLLAGVGLTILGVVLIDRPEQSDRHVDQHV